MARSLFLLLFLSFGVCVLLFFWGGGGTLWLFLQFVRLSGQFFHGSSNYNNIGSFLGGNVSCILMGRHMFGNLLQ